MNGYEPAASNNMFYLCSLIENIGRMSKNKRSVVVNEMGKDKLAHILDLADVYHCEYINDVGEDVINDCGIAMGTFDNVADCRYDTPSSWDIGKVYKRLVLAVAERDDLQPIDALLAVYNSFVSDLISDFNSAFYYDSPQNIALAYFTGSVIE